jgi:hypothetical protein
MTNKRARTFGAFNEQAYGISFDRENEEERVMLSIPNPRSDAQKAIVRIIKYVIGARSRQMNSRRIVEASKSDVATELKYKSPRELDNIRRQCFENTKLRIVITTPINTLSNTDKLEIENLHTLPFRAVLEYRNNCDTKIDNLSHQIYLLQLEIENTKIKKEYSAEMVTKGSFQDSSALILETIDEMKTISYNQEFDDDDIDLQPLQGISSSSSNNFSSSSSLLSSSSSSNNFSSSSSSSFSMSGMTRMVEEIDE